MSPSIRRLALTAHITASVGWVGAALVFLALAALGLTSRDHLLVRGSYMVMQPAAWLVLLPLALASLLTGLVVSLGTPWGLFRHYWVVLKLLITVFSTAVLLIYMQTFREMADIAGDPRVALAQVRNPSPVLHAILALVLLMTATLLAIYKPLGLTAYGRQKHGQSRSAVREPPTAPSGSSQGTPRWAYLCGVLAAAVILLLVLMHLAGGTFATTDGAATNAWTTNLEPAQTTAGGRHARKAKRASDTTAKRPTHRRSAT